MVATLVRLFCPFLPFSSSLLCSRMQLMALISLRVMQINNKTTEEEAVLAVKVKEGPFAADYSGATLWRGNGC